MGHLVGCFEFEPLSGPVIQSFLGHSLLFIGNNFIASFLGDTLAKKPVEALDADSLPAAKSKSKLRMDAMVLILVYCTNSLP